MPAISANFPGKIILFGEHAVVYQSHAIAIPVNEVRSRAVITPLVHASPGEIEVVAPDIQLQASLSALSEDDPIAYAIRLSLEQLKIPIPPAFSIRITSTIPIAAGMGSGASISCSITKAVSSYFGRPFKTEEISAIAFEVEKLHHGTPSGVDNTVIAHGLPVYFKRGDSFPIILKGGAKFVFIIADTGIKAKTSDVVGDVRQAWEKDQPHYDQIFAQIDQVTTQAFSAIQSGKIELVGNLMTENHRLLQSINVSHPLLDTLVSSALSSGAYGAKLSGAGRGGNMIALVPEQKVDKIHSALITAGAVKVIQTVL